MFTTSKNLLKMVCVCVFFFVCGDADGSNEGGDHLFRFRFLCLHTPRFASVCSDWFIRMCLTRIDGGVGALESASIFAVMHRRQAARHSSDAHKLDVFNCESASVAIEREHCSKICAAFDWNTPQHAPVFHFGATALRSIHLKITFNLFEAAYRLSLSHFFF